MNITNVSELKEIVPVRSAGYRWHQMESREIVQEGVQRGCGRFLSLWGLSVLHRGRTTHGTETDNTRPIKKGVEKFNKIDRRESDRVLWAHMKGRLGKKEPKVSDHGRCELTIAENKAWGLRERFVLGKKKTFRVPMRRLRGEPTRSFRTLNLGLHGQKKRKSGGKNPRSPYFHEWVHRGQGPQQRLPGGRGGINSGRQGRLVGKNPQMARKN